VIRWLIYGLVYRGIAKALYIGKLNKEHLLRHGIPAERLFSANYCVADPIVRLPDHKKDEMRNELRAQLGIQVDDLVISFFGKLIEKKDPVLLLESLRGLKLPASRRLYCLIVGSGELESTLRKKADDLQKSDSVTTLFAGFVNQSRLPAYYLASDIVVLPSRRMGETWGLVVNEALQAGCGAVVSDCVGCHVDFAGWERVRICAQGNAEHLSKAINALARYPRNFNWARDKLRDYSVEAAALAISSLIDSLPDQR